MRRPAIAANWKMHKTAAEAAAFARDFLPRVKDAGEKDVILAPPFTALARLGEELSGSRVALAAQNVHASEKGAFTGEVATGMLVELGCRQAFHIGKALHEAFVIGDDGGNLGLLQHDFGHPDPVGCGVLLPGQVVAPVSVEPGQRLGGEPVQGVCSSRGWRAAYRNASRCHPSDD